MEGKYKPKKRPCRVWRQWFTPNLRLGDRQRTCGGLECQRKWHARKCAEWNRKNGAYFKEIYLRGQLESFGSDPPGGEVGEVGAQSSEKGKGSGNG